MVGDGWRVQGPVHLRPLSEGSVTISSGSTWDKAVIEPKCVFHPLSLSSLPSVY